MSCLSLSLAYAPRFWSMGAVVAIEVAIAVSYGLFSAALVVIFSGYFSSVTGSCLATWLRSLSSNPTLAMAAAAAVVISSFAHPSNSKLR